MTAALLSCAAPWAAAQAPPGEFTCGGAVEQSIWALWDTAGRNFIRETMLKERLRGNGDSYALYDIQGYLQNLVTMAMQCRRGSRLTQLAELLDPAFEQQEALSPDRTASDPGRGWVCRGGRVCNTANKLVGREIPLNSLQFLTLALQVAEALAEAPAASPSDDFVQHAAVAAYDHLARWHRQLNGQEMAARRAATPAAVRDGSSRLFFTDTDLWVLAVHAQLAGLLQARPALRKAMPQGGDVAAWHDGLAAQFGLLRSRLTLSTVDSKRAGKVETADLDRGFWRLHRDSRYAGYSGEVQPMTCGAAGRGDSKVNIPADQVQVLDDIGWDFSHARRLVHALAAIDRNRAATQAVYGVKPAELPPPDLARKFAAQLVTRVWDGNLERPRFANYWSGANGWYRVAYDNAATCTNGYPPYGLSDAFTTGGFAFWARHYPVLGQLAQQVYKLAQSGADPAYIDTYYTGLGKRSTGNNLMLTQLMFWPALVQPAASP